MSGNPGTTKQLNSFGKKYQAKEFETGSGELPGFVLALLALLGCWIPVLNWILWLLGFIFSFIGIFKSPRGLAIAGLCISLVDLIPLILLLGFAAALLI